MPVLGAPLAHAAVLRYDLLPALKRPLDMGARLGGRRLLGDNKTWRGAAVMFLGVVGLTLALSARDGYWSELPEDLQDAGPLLVGCLVGAAVVLGELPNSFLKRRLGIPPGGRHRSAAGVALSLWDQVDFVPLLVLLLAPIWLMPLPTFLVALAVVAAVDLVINLIGYAIGARAEPV